MLWQADANTVLPVWVLLTADGAAAMSYFSLRMCYASHRVDVVSFRKCDNHASSLLHLQLCSHLWVLIEHFAIITA